MATTSTGVSELFKGGRAKTSKKPVKQPSVKVSKTKILRSNNLPRT